MSKPEKVGLLPPPVLDEQLKKIKNILPELFAEGKLDASKLRELLGEAVEEETERYRFSWAGKRDAIQMLQIPTRATLVPSREESINFDATGNIFIEGDNLEVLKLLYKPYFASVKAIYIDPPYNTGGDFVYRDDYKDPLNNYQKLTRQKDDEGNRLTSNDEKSGRYHSGWLSMMYPRLFLARQLLKDDGIIFVSIDDHEVYNLRMLMNEIFGEENLFQQVVWQRHAGGGNNAKHFAIDHEYILVYAKNKQHIPTLKFPLSDEQKREYSEIDEWHSTLGPYKVRSFQQNRPANPRPGLQYDIKLPDGTKVFDQWKWQESRFLKAKRENKMVFTKDPRGKWRVGYKMYLNTIKRLPRSLLTQVERNVEGKKQLSDVLGQPDILNNPKPVGLIKHLLEFSTDPDSIVVDFFAGSCTTAQALLELNKENNGNRRFIMVQLPEPTPEKSIAKKAGYETISEIGKQRILRLLAKMQSDQGLLRSVDLGVKIFQLAKSSYRLWNGVAEHAPDKYQEQMDLFSTEPLIDNWIPENVIYEIAVKEGLRLDSIIGQVKDMEQNTIFRVSSADKKQAFYICLDEELFQDDIDKLGLVNNDLFICFDKALDDTKAANLALQCRLKTI